MDTIDFVILALILVPGIWMGLKNGFIRQAVTLAAVFAGAFLAGKYGPDFAQWISSTVHWKPVVCRVTAFVLLFFATYLVFLFVGNLLQKIMKGLFGEWLNRLLGVILGIVKFGLIVGLLAMAFDSLNAKLDFVDAGDLESSPVYSALQEAMKVIFPYLKGLLGKGGL